MVVHLYDVMYVHVTLKCTSVRDDSSRHRSVTTVKLHIVEVIVLVHVGNNNNVPFLSLNSYSYQATKDNKVFWC